jgi:hypothetical protein
MKTYDDEIERLQDCEISLLEKTDEIDSTMKNLEAKILKKNSKQKNNELIKEKNKQTKQRNN